MPDAKTAVLESLRDGLSLGKSMLLEPSQLAERVRDEPRPFLRGAAALFLIFMAASAVFYDLKPEGFPPPAPDSPEFLEDHGLLFWAGVQLWSPVLLGAWVAAAGWYGRILNGRKLAARLAAAVGATGVLLLLLVLYSMPDAFMPRWTFAAAWAVLIALMIPGLKKVSQEQWLATVVFFAGAHAAAIAMLIPFSVAVLLRSKELYMGAEILLLFATLRIATIGLSRFLGIGTARAFSAVFLSLLAQILFVFSMRMLGLLPKEVLKAIMAA